MAPGMISIVEKSTFLHVRLEEDDDSNFDGELAPRALRRAASEPAGRRAQDGAPAYTYAPDLATGRYPWQRVASTRLGAAAAGCGVRAPQAPPRSDGAAKGFCESLGTTSASAGGSDTVAPSGGTGSTRSEDEARTTVMMRNIPDAFSRKRMLQLLDSEGFHGEYDFVYLPIDFRTASLTGFAFVNLTSRDAAQRFFAHFHRFGRWSVRTRKLCNVSWARGEQQGLSANVERYRNSSVMHSSVSEDHKPLLLAGGAPRPFPKPTKRIYAPRAGGRA